MKSVSEILSEIDSLLRESKLHEAEKYMTEQLSEAKASGEWMTSLTLLNEMAGFYRDIGQMKNALEACMESEKIMDANNVGKTRERAAAYLNTANVYRAMKEAEESFIYYKKALEVIEVCGDASLYSSYYNNLALLHQEVGKFDDAVQCLKKALVIADEKLGDKIRVAISRTNLATSLIRLKRLDEAYEYLKPAIDIFAGRTPSDFHFSAALSAMGDLCCLRGELKKAAEYFEQALSEIELHMGKNNFYEIVSDNLAKVYEMIGEKPVLSGIELCNKYFNAFGRPVIEANFAHLKEHIACGLFGEGSECLGFDDAISRDHDFGPAFVIVVDSQVTDGDVKALQKMYENLPKTFMGCKRLETPEAKGRVGVVRIEDLFKKATGFDHIPKGYEEWQYTLDENLLLLTNGKIFMDEGQFLTDIRKHIIYDEPSFVYFNKLALNLELMAKHGQYAYKRAFDRKDSVSALIAKTEFVKATLKACHLICKERAPYDKWLFKSFEKLTKARFGRGQELKEIVKLIDKISARGINPNDSDEIENICKIIADVLRKCGLIKTKESYLAVAAHELKVFASKTVIADKIVDIEWALFDKTQNAGGRAGCQDDWGTFSIMRRSQYYTWPKELLMLLLTDYTEAANNGRNVITEKYGYMMKSTCPEEFNKIEKMLPEVSDDKCAIINAIVEIQVGWMEKFASEYPGLASNARAIHSTEDTPYLTSYETYLRGELSTYHDDTLSAYGRMIAGMANAGENLAYEIMRMTTYFYGYASLDDAMKNN